MTNLQRCSVSGSLDLIIVLTRHHRLMIFEENTQPNALREILENRCLIH